MATKINPFNGGHLDYVGGGGAGNTGTISAGTTNATLGQVVFSNSNGVSFGIDGQTVTASVNAAGGGLTNINLSAGTTSNNLSAFTFNNANGITFGLNASTITASHNGLTSQSNQAFSAEGGSSAFQTLIFTNSNGISFSNTGGSIWGSHNGLTSQSNQAFSADGGSSAFQTLNFRNANGISFSNSGGSVQASYTVPSQSNQNISLYGLGNTTQNSSTVLNASNLSFNAIGSLTVGYSNGSIQLSAPNALTSQTNQNLSLYGLGNTTQNSSTVLNASAISYNGLGIVTVGYSNGSIQLSATQSNQAFSAAGGSSAFQTLGFSDNSNVSFTNTNGSVGVVSLRGSFYAVSNTTQSTSMTQNLNALSFHGAGIASVGASNGSIIISVPAGGGAGDGYNILAAGTQTANTTGTVVFSNSNNMTFGMSNNSIVTASFNAINVGVSDLGNTLGTTGTVEGAGGQYLFVGSQGITLSQSTNGANSGTVTILGVAPVFSYEPYPFNQSASSVLSANTNTSGAASFFPFIVAEPVAAGMLMMVQSMNFVTVGAASGRQSQTISYGLYSQGTGTNSTKLSAFTSHSYALEVTGNASSYTINQPTSSNTAGYTTGTTNSSGVNISSGYTGFKNVQFPVQSTLSPGNYWLGLFVRNSTSSNNVGISQSFVGGIIGSATVQNIAPIGSFSTAFSTGTNVLLRWGPYRIGQASFTSAAQTNLPGTVALSAMTHNVPVIPHMYFWSNKT